MDPLVVRWESLALVVAALVLAGWALYDSTRVPAGASKGEGAHGHCLLIEVVCPGQPSRVTEFRDGTLIGRGAQCHIILHDAGVSKEHARLRVDGSQAFVEDLHSTNGTLVNGKVIAGPTPLKPGDRIGLGANVIWFLGEAPSQPM
jgi:hypothetical protein